MTSPAVEARGTQASCLRAQGTLRLEAREGNEDERCGVPQEVSVFASPASVDAMNDRSLDIFIVEQVIEKNE